MKLFRAAMKRRAFGRLSVGAVTLLLLLFGVAFSWWVLKQTDRRMRDELLYQVRLAVQAVNTEQVRALSGNEEDVSKTEYQALQRSLAALRETAGCRFLYLMRRRPVEGDETKSEVVFLIEEQDDALESTPPSQPGDVYEDEFVTEELAALFGGGDPFVEGPVEDEWGIWVSALAPLVDRRTEDLLAVLGMDYDASLWRRRVATESALPISLTLLVLLLLGVLQHRKEKEQAVLRESVALLKNMSKQIPGVIFQFQQYSDGRFLVPFVSEHVRDVFEFSPEEVEKNASKVFSRVHPDDRVSFMASIARSFETLEVWEEEFRVVLPEKGERWLHGMGNPERRPDGSVLWFGYIADSTERRRREDEVKRQAGLISSLLSSIPDIVFYKDKDGVFLGCNPPYEELTGRREEELIGRTDYDFYDKETADFHREKDVFALSTVQPQRNEEWVTYPDGRSALLDTLKTPIRGRDGELLGLLGISRDITDRKRMEEELQRALDAANAASLAKSDFLASMSHEIRTPLNAILGFSQLLERDPELAPGHMTYVNIINRSGEHLLGLINDILDMAKIEAGRVTLNKGFFNPCIVLADIGSLFRTLLDQKSLSLNVERDETLHSKMLYGDEGKLRQVLVNLLGNAVKFTQEGGVTVRVHTEEPTGISSGSEEALFLVVEVEDTGVGISPEQSETVFAAFQQSDAGKRAGGTGLGLAISRKFVEIMGGELTFESELGKGSCFRFRIPVERAQENVERLTTEGGRVVGLKPGRSVTVLIVDDDEPGRNLLLELLSGAGFECVAAANGEEAVELFEYLLPDVVLMDLNMPVLDGYEATRRIKAGAGRETPVIALTADVFAKEAVAVCGADAYLRKPLVAGELFGVLRDVLDLEYIYGDDPAGGSGGVVGASPVVPDLSRVAGHILRELLASVEEGDMPRIKRLIRRISAEDRSTGDALLLLAERYDYEKLVRILQQEGERFGDE